MRKGTILHNHREDFFNEFDVKKAETMNNSEITEYVTSLMPVDEYYDISLTVAAFEAQRFIEAKSEEKVDEYLPIVNEGLFDCEVTIPKNVNKKFPLQRDYVVRLQGIIDRIFIEDGKLIPFEYKTGGWKDWKTTSMRQEMAFYQLLIENCDEEVLAEHKDVAECAVIGISDKLKGQLPIGLLALKAGVTKEKKDIIDE